MATSQEAKRIYIQCMYHAIARRYDTRKFIEAWRTEAEQGNRVPELKDGLYPYLCEELPPGMDLTKNKAYRIYHPKDAPNTEVIEHIARRLGADTPREVLLFRRMVFDYPLTAGQKEVDQAVAALAATPVAHNEERREAFRELERALQQRDGLRRKFPPHQEIAHVMVEAALEYDRNSAHTEKLLPEGSPISKYAETTLYNALTHMANKGGEMMLATAKIMAPYICPEDPDSVLEALAKNRRQEESPGTGAQFRKGEKPIRPGWSHEESMKAWKEKHGKDGDRTP